MLWWNPPGSHGCVNIYHEGRCKKYSSLLKNGDDVSLKYGRKAGHLSPWRSRHAPGCVPEPGTAGRAPAPSRADLSA